MRYSLIVFLIFTLQFSFGQNFPGLFFGGSNNDRGTSICTTHEDGYLLVGSTRSFGSGSDDVYIIKIGHDFNLIWKKTIGWEHSDLIRSVIKVNDGFLLCGEVWDFGMAGYDVSLLKISMDGELIWKKFYGSHSVERGMKVVQSEDSSLVLLGYSRFYDNKGDIFIIKTDKNGDEIWRNNFDFGYDDYGFDLSLDQDNNIVVVGSKQGYYKDVHDTFKIHDADYFILKIDDEGNEILRKTFGGSGHDFGSALLLQEDQLIYVGSSQSGSNGSFDMDINIIEDDTIIVSTEKYGGQEYDYGTSIVHNSENDYFVLGSTKSFGTNNSTDVYLLKFDKYNSLLWQSTFGGPGIDYGIEMVATSDGGCAVVCESNSYEDGSFNFLFIKINEYGEIEDIIENIDSNYMNNIAAIHPNPISNSGQLAIENSNIEYIIQFYNLTGMKIEEVLLTPPRLSINVSNLKPGAYVYRVFPKENRAKVYTGTLIVN